MSPALIHGSVDHWLAQREACGELVDAWHKVAAEYGAGHPVALGVLLALVRKAWGHQGIYARESSSGGWGVYVRRFAGGPDLTGVFRRATEAEALVAALEAAP